MWRSSTMIPLTESLKIAFKAIVDGRPKEQSHLNFLDEMELVYVKRFLRDNALFACSDDEIAILFASHQQKRFKKKAKPSAKQMALPL